METIWWKKKEHSQVTIKYENGNNRSWGLIYVYTVISINLHVNAFLVKTKFIFEKLKFFLFLFDEWDALGLAVHIFSLGDAYFWFRKTQYKGVFRALLNI